MRKLTHSNKNQIFSTREVADLLSTVEWKVRRLYEDGTLAEPVRFAGKRMIHEDQFPEILAAMKSRGWLEASVSAESSNNHSDQADCEKKQEANDE